MPASNPDLASLQPLLGREGFILESEQPHLSEERALMRPEKMILLCKMKGGERVALKVSKVPAGIAEIKSEKKIADLLGKTPFAADALLAPEELYYKELGEYTLRGTRYIPQERGFVELPLEEQFFLALRVFESQEAFHATTYNHLKQVRGVVPLYSPEDYLSDMRSFEDAVKKEHSNIGEDIAKARQCIENNRITLERYGNYLTHTDLAPINMRVCKRQVYLLDFPAMHFGNKYEGWARFINYMVVHNPPLAGLLAEYVRKNRGEDEHLCLRLMRLYKASLLLRFYASILPKTSGDLRKLTELRLNIWREILTNILTDTELPGEVLTEYLENRRPLRSEDEKKRQLEIGAAI